jgi:GT2 family glycosyltransferase
VRDQGNVATENNSGSSPSVGVVIPCHDNSRELYGVLKALQSQTDYAETIVVVDDNSSSSEERKLRSLCLRFGALYKKLPSPQNRLETLGRRSQARNAGTQSLETDVVLYLDGDILLTPTYIEEIRHYHHVLHNVYIRARRFEIQAIDQTRGIDACLKTISTHLPRLSQRSVQYVISPDDFIWQQLYQSVYQDKWEWCASNNLSVRREYVAKIGYWDENFVGWGEEDMDFSFRLSQFGLTPAILISEAAAYHLEHPINHAANLLTLKRNAKYLLNKFPEVAAHREEAYKRYHLNVNDLS